MNLNISIENHQSNFKKRRNDDASPTFSDIKTESESNTPISPMSLTIKIPKDNRKQILKKEQHKCTFMCVKNCKVLFQNHACGREDCDGKCGVLKCGCIEICTEH